MQIHHHANPPAIRGKNLGRTIALLGHSRAWLYFRWRTEGVQVTRQQVSRRRFQFRSLVHLARPGLPPGVALVRPLGELVALGALGVAERAHQRVRPNRKREFHLSSPKVHLHPHNLRRQSRAMIRRLLCFLVLAGLRGPLLLEASPRADHVFIISIDGGAPAVIQQSRMPVLKKLAAQGAYTWNAQTIKPCLTLPAHTSMLTGVGAERHQVTWNNWTPTNGLVGVPTIFSVAKTAGLATGMFVGKEKFRHLLLPNTVDEFDYDEAHSLVVLKSASGQGEKKKEGTVMAKLVATNAAIYILKYKPGLCFIHFTDPDTVGHEFGWGTPEQIKAFADVDAALDIVLEAIRQAGIARSSVILLSADHGGHGKGHSQATPADLQIPWIAWGRGVKQGFEITAPVNTCDTAATALWLLDLPAAILLEGAVVSSAFQ